MVPMNWHQRNAWHPRGGFTRFFEAVIPLADPTLAIQYALLPFNHDDSATTLAHGRYFSSFGQQAPVHRGILLILQGPRQRVEDRYSSIAPAHWHGLKIVDADAFEVQALQHGVSKNWLRCDEGILSVQSMEQGASEQEAIHLAAVCNELQRTRRFHFFPAGNDDLRNTVTAPGDVSLVVPLGQSGAFLSSRVSSGISFTGGFFILPEEEFTADPFSRCMDHVGLAVSNGEVLVPPLYRRPSLLLCRKNGEVGFRPLIATTSMEDVLINFNNHVEVDGSRAVTRGSIDGTTCADVGGQDEDGVLCAIVDNRFVAAGHPTPGSHVSPPINGFLVFLSSDEFETMDVASAVRYSLKDRSVKEGCAGWVQLLDNGCVLDLTLAGAASEYRPLEPDEVGVGIPPVHLFERYLHSDSRANIAVGVRGPSELIVVMAEGTELRSTDLDVDSRGSSLLVLAERLLALGCRSAVALDGGGSASVMAKHVLLSRPADRFDVRWVPQERPITGYWSIFGKV